MRSARYLALVLAGCAAPGPGPGPVGDPPPECHPGLQRDCLCLNLAVGRRACVSWGYWTPCAPCDVPPRPGCEDRACGTNVAGESCGVCAVGWLCDESSWRCLPEDP